MGMTVDLCIAVLAADTVGMIGLRQRKRSQHRTNGVIARHVQLGGLLIGEGLYFCINGFQLLLNFGRIVLRDCFRQGVNECLHSQHRLLFSKTGREVCILRRADRTVEIDRLLLTVGLAAALRRSIPGRARNKPAVLRIAQFTGIPAGRPLCGRNVAAGIVMFAAFMRAA